MSKTKLVYLGIRKLWVGVKVEIGDEVVEIRLMYEGAEAVVVFIQE